MNTRKQLLLLAFSTVIVIVLYNVSLLPIGESTTRYKYELFISTTKLKVVTEANSVPLLSLQYENSQWTFLFGNNTSIAPLFPFRYEITQSTYQVSGNVARSRAYQHHIPTLHCPDEERVGYYGDGAKWVCKPRQLLNQANCIVYSFGSNLQFSFEKHIQAISHENCHVHVFDPTPSVAKEAKNVKLPQNVFYHAWALGDKRGNPIILQGQRITKVYTFAEVMKKLGHTHLDVLKIDVEGSEWSLFLGPNLDGAVAPEDCQLFLDHRIGQLQLETHAGSAAGESADKAFDFLIKVFEQRYKLKLFHSELNEFCLSCWEWAFVDPLYKAGDKTIQEWVENHPYPPAMRQERTLDAVTELKRYQSKIQWANYDKQGAMTFMQEATDACDKLWFLGHPEHGPTVWCHDKLVDEQNVQLLSFWDHAYLIEDQTHRMPPILLPEEPEALLKTRWSWLNDLATRLQDKLIIHAYSADWGSVDSAISNLNILLDHNSDTNALHASLASADMFVAFVNKVMPHLSTKINTLVLDAHFCFKCYKGQEATVTIDEWSKAYIAMTQNGWRLVSKKILVNELSPANVGLKELGHYGYALIR